jgi:hypothetical protein
MKKTWKLSEHDKHLIRNRAVMGHRRAAIAADLRVSATAVGYVIKQSVSEGILVMKSCPCCGAVSLDYGPHHAYGGKYAS